MTPISSSNKRKSAYVSPQIALVDQRADEKDSRELTNLSVQNHYKASLGAAIAYATQRAGA